MLRTTLRGRSCRRNGPAHLILNYSLRNSSQTSLSTFSSRLLSVVAAPRHVLRYQNRRSLFLNNGQLGVLAGLSNHLYHETRSIHSDHSRLNESSPTQQTVDQSLLRLDSEIRKTGRINRREIEEILGDIREMKSATSSQSLMIIRCCGELVPEEAPENRTKLVQEIWKTMESLNVPMDISHYNALLRVYIENEHKFNPTEFLQELERKGIEPNRVTYQRLIARFCQDGDIEGASTILQHMKEKQLPINAHVFNALILGHAIANDMDSAEGIIGVMKQAGLEPNDDTYATLMLGYAKKGDITNIKRIVEDCEKNDIFLLDRDFLEIIFTLAQSKHENLIDEVIPLLRKQAGFIQEATNIILRLVTIGKEEEAYKLLKCMPRGMRQGQDELAPSGFFFVKQLVLSSTPSDKVIKYCHLMATDNLNTRALTKATETALSFNKFEKAIDFIEALHESGYPIRQHYFWPFFAKSNSEKDVYEGLKSMLYSGLSPTTETLRDYVIPNLLRHGKTDKEFFEQTLDKLTTYTKIPSSLVVPAALHHILQEGNMKQACQLALKYRVRFHNAYVRKALVEAYVKTKDAHSLVRIVASSGFDNDEIARESVGAVLMELLEVVRLRRAEYLMPILKELLENGVGLSNSGAELLQDRLGEEITPEITNLILQLTSSELSSKLNLFQAPKRSASASATASEEDLTTFQMETLLAESVKAGRTNKGLQKSLLMNYCREKQLEKADKLYEELKSQGFVMSIGMKALMLDLYSNFNQLEKAKPLYKEIVEIAVDQPLDETKILRYVYTLALNEEYQEALEVIKSQFAQPQKEDIRRARANNFQVNAIVWKILDLFAEKGDVEKVRELFNTLRANGFGQPNTMVLGPLVKAYLVKDDLDGALAEFERCTNEFNVTPWKQELFCRFIKSEDPERLQKVLDLSTKQHGEVNSLYDLVFAFLECGKVRQAKKILETPGLRTRNEKLELTCQRYYDEDRVAELENLIEITKDLFNVDRNSLYFYLLKSYCKAGDADKALSVWTSLQEENIQASPDLLIFLANFLRNNNRPVPFILPDLPTETIEVSPKGQEKTTTKEHEIDNYLNLNDLDRALQTKQMMDSEGKYLTIAQNSRLIDKLARAERLRDATKITEQLLDGGIYPYARVLFYLLGRLSAAGEIETLKRLEGKLSNELKRRTLFNSRLCVAYVNAGQGKRYFDEMIKPEANALISGEKADSNVNIPPSAATYILIRNDDLLPEFLDFASKTAEKGNKNLYNTVWLYHMLKKNFDKARNIWESDLKDLSRLYFKSVIINAVSASDEEMINELHQQTSRSSLHDRDKGSIVSARIEVLCAKGRPEEALKFLNEQLTNLSINDMELRYIKTLKEKLEAKSVSFPHELPKPTRGRGMQDSSSSSSSDSESDDEPAEATKQAEKF